MRHLAPALGLTFILSGMCIGQALAGEALTTDRPDFSESPEVVGKGRFQIETSVAFERNRRDGTRTRTRSTPTLLRLGVGKDWELRMESEGLMRERSSSSSSSTAGASERESGTADAEFGLKWHSQDGDEDAGKPSICWLLDLGVNSGSRAFRGTGLRPSLRMVSEWEFDGGWSLGVMPGVYAERNADGHRYVGGLLAVALGKDLSPRHSAFVEFAARQFASERNGGKPYTLDIGATYLLSPTVQVDAGADFGLNRNAADLTLALGISMKF